MAGDDVAPTGWARRQARNVSLFEALAHLSGNNGGGQAAAGSNDTMAGARAEEALTARQAGALRAFYALLCQLQAEVAQLPPAAAIDAVVKSTGLHKHVLISPNGKERWA